jgi:hypothetical protein
VRLNVLLHFHPLLEPSGFMPGMMNASRFLVVPVGPQQALHLAWLWA